MCLYYRFSQIIFKKILEKIEIRKDMVEKQKAEHLKENIKNNKEFEDECKKVYVLWF